MATTTTTTTQPAASGSPFAPSGLIFPNNDKLTNSDSSKFAQFQTFNPYIHYYSIAEQPTSDEDPESQDPNINMDAENRDVSYKINFAEDYDIATPWDLYSEEYRRQIKTNRK